jgi:hypothetical protein
LRRALVDQPESIRQEPWLGHLQDCAQCRQESHAWQRSLAVYRQLETERLADLPPGPSWDRLAAALAQDGSPRRRRWRLPLVAAVGAAVMVTGAISGTYLATSRGAIGTMASSQTARRETAERAPLSMSQSIPAAPVTRVFSPTPAWRQVPQFRGAADDQVPQEGLAMSRDGRVIMPQSALDDPVFFLPASRAERAVQHAGGVSVTFPR